MWHDHMLQQGTMAKKMTIPVHAVLFSSLKGHLLHPRRGLQCEWMPVNGGGPRLMELVCLAGATQIMTSLGLRGTIHTDRQGLVSHLYHYKKLRRVATMAGTTLLVQTWKLL